MGGPRVSAPPNAPWMMCLGRCYFVVLTPTGYHIQIEPYDPSYTEASLIPCLERFWHQSVLPAFQKRDELDAGESCPDGISRDAVRCYPGWVPPAAKRTPTATLDGYVAKRGLGHPAS